VKYQDGSPGFQCAGFGPNNTTNPFVCVGTYSTDKCLQGYNCSTATKQCVLTDPGNGMPQEQCQSTCFPKTYTCSPINVSCVETPANQGGIPLSVCQAQCKSSNNTPTDLMGNWRGLEISGGYIKNEYRLAVNSTYALVYFPNGTLYYAGTVSQVQDYVVITGTNTKIFALYQTEIGPVTKWMTIASSRPGGPPPVTFDDAMASPSAQEFVFESCIDSSICNFGAATTSTVEQIRKPVAAPTGPPIDHCAVFENCTTCLNSPYCGWCSAKVIYQGNVLGANCAGFNQNETDNPFVCVGTYSTQKCPIPPPQYSCNSNSSQCVISQSGQSASVCNATCGKNNTNLLYKCNVEKMTCEPDQAGQDPATCNSTCQIRPIPVDLNGVWRGIQVNQNYTKGEWRMVITSFDNFNSNFTITNPNNITLSGGMQHVGSEAVLIVKITSPVTATRYSLYELAYGPETAYLTLANGAYGSDTYPSFIQAMTGTGMSELTYVRCLNPNNCKFL